MENLSHFCGQFGGHVWGLFGRQLVDNFDEYFGDDLLKHYGQLKSFLWTIWWTIWQTLSVENLVDNSVDIIGGQF